MNQDKLKKAAIIVSCVSMSVVAVGEWPKAVSLEEGFSHPPMSARAQTWWHWMNGNVSKEGITADLEAMREIGLGGELRAVSRASERVRECARLGFKTCIVPKASLSSLDKRDCSGIRVIGASNLSQLFKAAESL